jgi:cobalamin-dependent methionine synthase I
VHIQYAIFVDVYADKDERDRMGRMLTFAARILQDSDAVDVPIVRAIGNYMIHIEET